MYEILKRALDEALTAAYAGEIPVGAEEVAFSEGFEREMRGLIRKTDRPIQKYIPILTAAACAAIAIGCAVLLPRLLSNPVPVEPNEDSTATVTSPAPIDEPVESSSTAGTTPDEPHEIQDENPSAAGGVSDDKEDTTEWDDEDGDVAGENGVPAVTGSSVSTPDPYPQDPNDFPATVIPDSEETTTNDKDDDTVDEDDEGDDTV
ncbi:MAG: hypothetical protein K2N29_03700, partial [Ruminiclostridium sp.]|nr:hypothetical protein [Ruminiclostridium sp.]